jgi:hypothetical protein
VKTDPVAAMIALPCPSSDPVKTMSPSLNLVIATGSAVMAATPMSSQSDSKRILKEDLIMPEA